MATEIEAIDLDALRARVGELRRFFDLPKLQAQLSELETRMASADFWSNRERAQAVVEEASRAAQFD